MFDDTKYGIPLVEEGRRSSRRSGMPSPFAPAGKGSTAAISSYRATLGVKRYNHDELDGEEVATHFDNDTEEGELLLSHKPFGRLSGTVGGSFLNRRFNTEGEEVLAPPIDQQRRRVLPLRGAGVAARDGAVRRARSITRSFAPDGGPARANVQRVSGSVGPAAAAGRRERQLRRSR